MVATLYLDPSRPASDITSNYLDFLDELQNAQFGEIDPSGEAAHKLNNLTMKDHHRAAKYSIQFTTISAQTRFDKQPCTIDSTRVWPLGSKTS